MTTPVLDIPIAHVDDADAVAKLVDVLRALHGPGYDFAVGRWSGDAILKAPPGRVIHRFIIFAENAFIDLHPDELVRGPAPEGPYLPAEAVPAEAQLARVTALHREALWPGDVVCVADGDEWSALLCGSATYFDVIAESTAYQAPRLAMLRHLTSKPGGCAAYPGAFRREALPPQRPSAEAVDRRGANRVNEHTLDMRIDRNPPPIRHYHGPVQIGEGELINHSETAIVISRATYDLPEVDPSGEGQVVIYRRPADDPSDTVVIPVRPGSIVVTPATPDNVMGHVFENCFAMLVAIPGFVSPYNIINQ